MVACGDREDFCSLCALCLPEGKAQGAQTTKENQSCRGSASARTRLLRSPVFREEKACIPFIYLLFLEVEQQYGDTSS